MNDYDYFLTNLQYAQSFASLEEADAWVQKAYRSGRTIIIHNTKGVELKPSPIHGIGCFATNVGRKKLDPGSMRLLDVPAEGDVVFKKGDSVGLALWEDAMRTELGRFSATTRSLPMLSVSMTISLQSHDWVSFLSKPHKPSSMAMKSPLITAPALNIYDKRNN